VHFIFSDTSPSRRPCCPSACEARPSNASLTLGLADRGRRLDAAERQAVEQKMRSCAASYSSASRPLACPAFDLRSSVRQGSLLRRRDLNPQPPISEGAPSLFWLVLNASCAAYSSPWGRTCQLRAWRKLCAWPMNQRSQSKHHKRRMPGVRGRSPTLSTA